MVPYVPRPQRGPSVKAGLFRKDEFHKAVNNKDRNFTRASLTEFIKLADAKLDDYLQRLDQSDATESRTGGSRVKNLAEKIAAIRQRRTRFEQMLAHLDQTGEEQISLTDPDSRAMAAHTRVGVGYNVQVAVDTKRGHRDPRAVHRDQLPDKQVQLAAEQHKLAEDRAEGAGVIASEVGDGLEVGFQMSQQPDHFDIAMGLSFEPAA